MRLFVALEIPAAVRESLSALIQEFREASARAKGKGPRWVRAENLHITLKFIGESAAEKLDAIRSALTGVRSESAVHLSCRGLGFFPNERRAQVLWAGLEATENLPRLAGDIDRGLESAGIARERRTFEPHLTLARFDAPRMEEDLRLAIARSASRDFGSFSADEFHLIESKTKPSGAKYTRIASFSFTVGA